MKNIKTRIRSMESTKQITKAMEMVAASKLRKAQDNVTRSRPYFETLYRTMVDIASSDTDLESPYIMEREAKRSCFVIIAGDRGLCGGYNHNIIKLAENAMREKVSCIVLPIGKKANETMRTHGWDIMSDMYTIAGAVTVSDCFTMARKLCEQFVDGKIDELVLAYTGFVSMLTQTPTLMTVLPLKRESIVSDAPKMVTLYEPSSLEVFDTIVPEYVGGLIYGGLCESIASEQGARRTAMDSATKNAEEIIDNLNLEYNRARQGAITQEITEIVGGANA